MPHEKFQEFLINPLKSANRMLKMAGHFRYLDFSEMSPNHGKIECYNPGESEISNFHARKRGNGICPSRKSNRSGQENLKVETLDSPHRGLKRAVARKKTQGRQIK